MNPEISVVIPAYNSGEYLERCLDSIRAQRFTGFEALVVNASSTDDTAEIARNYCRKDARFKMLQCEKAPPGIVRNHGMKKVGAKYIAFADSDDTMHPDMLGLMHNRIVKTDADITVCDFNMVYPDNIITGFAKLEDYFIQLTEDNVADYYYRFSAAPKPNNYVWSRLYKSEYLKKTGIRFESSAYSEDHTFNLMLMCHCPSIAHIGKPLYNYIQRKDSEVRRNAAQNHGELFLYSFNQAREYLESQNKAYTEPVLAIYAYTRIKSILFYANQAKLNGIEIHKALQSFICDIKVKHYLNLCTSKDYFATYCRIHRYPDKWQTMMRELLAACIDGREIGNINKIFD